MKMTDRKTKATCTYRPAENGTFYHSYKYKAYKRARWRRAAERMNNRILRQVWLDTYGTLDDYPTGVGAGDALGEQRRCVFDSTTGLKR